MKISSRCLNKNERFCCLKNDVKRIFGDADITVWFAKFHRDFIPDIKVENKSIFEGKIICQLSIYNTLGQIGANGCKSAFLNFYVLKYEEFNDKLYKEFISDVLPLMYCRYEKYQNKNLSNIGGKYILRVELLNGKLVIHDGIVI